MPWSVKLDERRLAAVDHLVKVRRGCIVDADVCLRVSGELIPRGSLQRLRARFVLIQDSLRSTTPGKEAVGSAAHNTQAPASAMATSAARAVAMVMRCCKVESIEAESCCGLGGFPSAFLRLLDTYVPCCTFLLEEVRDGAALDC